MKSALVTRSMLSISLKELKAEYIKKSGNKNELFQKEFKEIHELCEGLNLESDSYAKQENANKNRYSYIHGYKHSMVTLNKENKDLNYINASFIDGFHVKSKFIATQGPLGNTIADFWRMVWEQNSRLIVMMANVEEHGEIKCNQYWPDSEPQEHNDIRIELTEEIVQRDFVTRKLSLSRKVGNEMIARNVTQLHFRDWPDRGVPTTTTGIMRLNEETNRLWQQSMQIQGDSTSTGPIITHCSAGVGRTGTFICYDILCDMSKENDFINVPLVVIEMRKNRTMMLQSLSQYNFVHKLLWEKLNLPQTNYPLYQYYLENKQDNGFQTANSEYHLLEQARSLYSQVKDEECDKMNSNESHRVDKSQLPISEKWKRMVSRCLNVSRTNSSNSENDDILKEISRNEPKFTWLLTILLELHHQLQEGNKLDIFRTVKDFCDKDHKASITLEEYASLHYACVEYLAPEKNIV